MSQDVERFNHGSALTYALKGVDELSSQSRINSESLAYPIGEKYDVALDRETDDSIQTLDDARDAQSLVSAVNKLNLSSVENYESLLDEQTVHALDRDATIVDVITQLDVELTDAYCPREKDASKVTSKANRENIYVPDLVSDEGTVYMAKTLSSTAKVRMAWDLHPDNEVVVVDEYEMWERILGWEKLKQFPHGKNKIVEELGDQLSDEVLSILTSNDGGDTETKSDDGGSRGRRTRTKPSEEVLNLALSSKHNKRSKMQSKDIAESFEADEPVDVGRYSCADMLILFPTTSDKLMSEHWWVPGSKSFGDGGVAIANCNKGTFEYLNQYEQVWHIEDYLAQAEDYEFETNAGPVTLNTASLSNMVIHVMSRDLKQYFERRRVFEHMPQAIHEYAESELYNASTLPHEDDMVYTILDKEDAFWLRPELRTYNGEEEKPVVISGSHARDLGHTQSMTSDYKLYARSRLHEWDFDSVEMDLLDECSGIYISLDQGAFELVETLGELHDQGRRPYSNSPKSRWDE